MSQPGQDPYQSNPPHGSYNYAYDNYGHPFDSNNQASSSSSQQQQPPPQPPMYRQESEYSQYSQYQETDDEIEPFDVNAIDPALRLRTTKTAHSVIAESIRSEGERVNRRRSRLLKHLKRHGTTRLRTKSRRGRKHHGDGEDGAHDGLPSIADNEAGDFAPPQSTAGDSSGSGSGSAPDDPAAGLGGKRQKPLTRRSIYVNLPLPSDQLTPKGEPIVYYARNKVRTSKYTLVTFLPRNLFEQFHRVANIYFLALVILQLFSIFGATTPEIAMLPLVAILGMTAIKDGIEDWRRAKLDEEVNTSAATKLGNWKNYNQPTDPRNWFERLFHIGPDPTKPSKGVRKLREKEAKDGKQVVFERHAQESEQAAMEHLYGDAAPETPAGEGSPGDGSHLQLPGTTGPAFHALKGVASSDSLMGIHPPGRGRAISNASSAPSTWSRRSTGVIDYSKAVPGTAQWERTLWKKLEVGDIVLLRGDEQVPADLMVLSTSDADNLCFVETKNLDGETNLKVRKAVKATASIGSEEDIEHARFVLDSEPPHANLYSYNGVLKYKPAAGSAKVDVAEEIEAVTINEILLRGCTLRNTKWVIGLVVFTGADTKIMMNGGDTPSKRSKIEKETNFNVIMNFIILLLLCLVTALLHGYYRSLPNTSANFYEQHAQASDNIYLDSLVIFVSSLIVFQNIVPISLYITVEIVKTIQAYFIYQDIEMYYQPFDTPCVPKTWNISDDLGQIEYVFSDKTGTLTQNVMEFKKCSIGGVTFGEGFTEASLGALKREGKDVSHVMEDQEEELQEKKSVMLDHMKRIYKNRYLRDDKLTLVAPDLPKYLGDKNDPLREQLIAFFRALALCHTVLSDKPEPEDKPYVLDYKAESPDEEALVAAARDVGFPFVTRNSNKVDIEVLGQPERWIPLRVLEFNSTRKRMSTVMRSPDGQVVLFCKGADSVIYERLAKDHDETLKQSTLKDLETFANGGLRTLCIAYRNLSEEEFSSWSKKYDAACAATEDREGKIDECCELIEHSLQILGATALEDKLQQGVPDAIEMLHKAGIKLWILTGDKLQTAIEIGYSCNLLTNDMEVMIISTDSAAGARAQIEAGLNKMASIHGPPATKGGGKVEYAGRDASATFAVVIDGESLRYALSPELKPLFLSLGTQCSAVICCRVSPAQKAQTVKLVKDGCNAMTLSIGDGANDVAMIQEANIGVGLFGLEGSQAAMSADYAFGQFRFLTRLLLVHGRWSYVRIADMHANFFYKNVIWTITMFWFLIYSSFDATYMFQYTFIMLYNLVFTSLPVGILGAFDQDTNARASMAFPQLYKRGILGLEYTRFRFWVYMLDGLYQSAIVFFIPLLVYWDGATWHSSGYDTSDMYDLSSTIAAAAVTAANVYVGINTRYWTIIPGLVIPLSTVTVYVWIALYSVWAPVDYYGVVNIVAPTFNFWFTIVITVALAVGPHWLFRAFRQSYFYQDKDIIREAWVGGTLKDELGIPHRKKGRRRGHRDVEEARYHKRSEGLDTYEPTPLEMTQVGGAADPLLDSNSSLQSPTEGTTHSDSPDPYSGPSRPPRAPVREPPEIHAPPYEYQYTGADSPYSRGGGSPAFDNRQAPQAPPPTRSNPPSAFQHKQYDYNNATPSPTTRQQRKLPPKNGADADGDLTEVMEPENNANKNNTRDPQEIRPPSTAAGDFTADTQWANRPPSEADPAFAGYAV